MKNDNQKNITKHLSESRRTDRQSSRLSLIVALSGRDVSLETAVINTVVLGSACAFPLL